MKMKQKILNNMVYIAVVAVLITTTLIGMFTYYRYMEQVKSRIKDEAAYLAASLNVKDNQNLNKYKNITVSRITRVDQNGKVIYDSSGKEKSMGNHKNRTEIKEAYEKALMHDSSRITDDAMVVEDYGNHEVWLYEGSYKNIKITTPEDLEIGEIFARETYDKKK